MLLSGCDQLMQDDTPKPRPRTPADIANATMEKIKGESSRLCANHNFAPYFAKSACMADKITDKQLGDESTITAEQRDIMQKVIAQSDAIEKEEDALLKTYGGPVGNKIVDYKTTSYRPQRDKNNADLSNEKISWGEFNHKRQALTQELDDALKKITPQQ
jgi:hypothetical protein